MLILGIDSSGLTAAAALCENGKILSSACRLAFHPLLEKLLPLIDRVLQEVDGKPDGIAVACGPGSFTGLRIGISTAKGLAFSNNLPCAPVPTTMGLAHRMILAKESILCPVMDARRNAYYNQLFQVEAGTLLPLTPPRAIGVQELADELASYHLPVMINGDGGEKFISSLQDPSFTYTLAPAHLLLQDAASIALLGETMLHHGQGVSCDALSPMYCRQP